MKHNVKLGIDVFMEKHVSVLKGKRVGLLTNQTGANAKLISTIRLFHQHPDIHLTTLFAPEHGLKTAVKEGERFSHMVHEETGITVFSLYGQSKKPTPIMMEQVDVVVFDIQDIGSRYYTYLYSLVYMMQACAKIGKKVIILDRPNPIGGSAVEGNLLEDDFKSFVGLYPIPNRHGMTVGELATYFNEEFSIHCDLTVVEMEGWVRDCYITDIQLPWIPPSPNTTNLDMMLLYPGTCLIEGTNLSEGRGTTQPFEIIGAPFINGVYLQDEINALGMEGVTAREISFNPTYQKYEGKSCEGIQLHITNRTLFKPLSTIAQVLRVIAKMYPDELKFLEYDNLKHPMFDLLAGSDSLRKGLVTNQTDKFLLTCQLDSDKFIENRRPYLRYR
ncbi:DUF1343 domain-containing protein [Psychrobacillus sp. NEAU-3TGS]|uniref:exo-beta-N-acetylmuramidase NamZ family protein n=1 Tax=Psychrobacillus sp. NEAU-3TGS TaxID=2995412 RepID=UPI002497CF32|nr:DUF1343 domain-containing protein [Psychrobacillus sp. NEAU-3TGS]MDI2587184.1 DUF1343 domain-containing protein [Psychrobacillus sp. NEAU-3TGS]